MLRDTEEIDELSINKEVNSSDKKEQNNSQKLNNIGNNKKKELDKNTDKSDKVLNDDYNEKEKESDNNLANNNCNNNETLGANDSKENVISLDSSSEQKEDEMSQNVIEDESGEQNNNEKFRRKRRTKLDAEGCKAFTCPECGKSYLSTPALNMHRKLKHNYIGSSQRGRRPNILKEISNNNEKENGKGNGKLYGEEKFYAFFNEESRKPSLDSSKTITLKVISEFFIAFFKHFKSTFFHSLSNINSYEFYRFLITFWDNENQVYSFLNDDKDTERKFNAVLFKYLRKFAKKTNKNYLYNLSAVILFAVILYIFSTFF